MRRKQPSHKKSETSQTNFEALCQTISDSKYPLLKIEKLKIDPNIKIVDVSSLICQKLHSNSEENGVNSLDPFEDNVNSFEGFELGTEWSDIFREENCEEDFEGFQIGVSHIPCQTSVLPEEKIKGGSYINELDYTKDDVTNIFEEITEKEFEGFETDVEWTEYENVFNMIEEQNNEQLSKKIIEGEKLSDASFHGKSEPVDFVPCKKIDLELKEEPRDIMEGAGSLRRSRTEMLGEFLTDFQSSFDSFDHPNKPSRECEESMREEGGDSDLSLLHDSTDCEKETFQLYRELIKSDGLKRSEVEKEDRVESASGKEEEERAFNCFKCDFKSDEMEEVVLHVLRHRRKKEEYFNCCKCNYKTKKKDVFGTHLLKHLDFKLFKCGVCDYETNFKESLKVHWLNHSSTKIFKCFKCDYKTNSKSHLNLHLLRHKEVKELKCSECDFETNRKSVLKKHLLTHSDGKLFRCDRCEYGSNSKYNFKIHLMNHEGIKLLECFYCNYETNRRSDLKKHLHTHSSVKAIKCPECDYRTNVKRLLKVHSLTHGDSKPLKCSHCVYRTNRKCNLKIHLLTHNKEKTFKCFECPYGTNNKYQLHVHLLSHNAEKSFKCAQCPYQTNYKNQFRIHGFSHLEEKLFKCDECRFQSNYKGHFRRHLSMHAAK